MLSNNSAFACNYSGWLVDNIFPTRVLAYEAQSQFSLMTLATNV